jgi:hypothetical protein
MRISIEGLKDSYYAIEADEGATDSYFGFMDKVGNWFIIKMSVSSNLTSTRYNRGSAHDSFTTAWANRASLSYSYPNEVF